MNTYQTGMKAQNGAELFLKEKGYCILERNYRIKSGEIDLIAQNKENIVFVEVKFRKNLNYGYPCESVGNAKQKLIISTALHYIAVNELNNHNFRFDVVEVIEQNGRLYAKHIENAFET